MTTSTPTRGRPRDEETAAPDAAGATGLERTLAVVILLYSTASFTRLFRPIDALGQGDPLLQLLWVPLYSMAGFTLLRSHRLTRFRLDPLIVAFLVLAGASTFWSDDPNLTIRRFVALAGTAVCALFLASRFSQWDLARLVRRMTTIVGVGSIAWLVIASGDALDPVHGTLRGVCTTKNELGRIMALGAIIGILEHQHRHMRQSLFVVVGHLGVLLATGSKTSLVVFIVVATLLVIARGLANPARTVTTAGLMFLGAAVLTVGLFAVGGVSGVLDALGRDSNLTGRTELWRGVIAAIRDRPLLGYGYGAFWQGKTPIADLVRIRANFAAPHAHNGLLDIWLQTGALGALIVACTILRGIVRSWGGARLRVLGGGLALAVLAFAIATNVTESSLLVQNTYGALLIIACTAHARRSPG